MKNILYASYKFFLPVIALIMLPLIFVALIFVPKFRAGFFEKLGFYGKIKVPLNKEVVAFHAVSLGETNAVAPAVKAFREKNPDTVIVFTNTTKTGHDAAVKSLSGVVDYIAYFPLDFSFSVNSFLNTFRPSKIVIAETEIWPAFVFESAKRKIGLYVANGRLSPHSYRGYKKFSFIFKPILEKYTALIMQSQDDVKRIVDVGAPSDRTVCGGNLKFDIDRNMNAEETAAMNERFKSFGKEIFIAASTHKGEDEIVIDLYKKLKKSRPSLKFLLAPRHPERFESVFELLKSENLNSGKVSAGDNFDDFDVILADTTGELSKYFSFCKFAFIGGSFSGTGGHNPLEAAIWNKPAVSGADVFNFKDVYGILTQKQAAFVVSNPEELFEICLKLLSDVEFYDFACNNTRSVFDENKGAVENLTDILKNSCL